MRRLISRASYRRSFEAVNFNSAPDNLPEDKTPAANRVPSFQEVLTNVLGLLHRCPTTTVSCRLAPYRLSWRGL
ncbi:hypothetical protein BDD14_2568 [Edaphobacter modestus]|uniref:Uncharacterized protein n=1 Tax=Edaphobacter modestus TaxID=388466 RepID=A0A4Q7YVL2_9BACT|nr:hypothetical protein BDD14_2568 [Edaphobacter modestus]